MTYGARVMFSTPPATNASPSPALIACAALAIACSPEPQRRFTVCPGTSTGKPASNAAIRATLRLSSPAWFVHPRITSSRRAGSNETRSTAPRTATAARSSARTSASAPPARPTGVRTAETMRASRIHWRITEDVGPAEAGPYKRRSGRLKPAPTQGRPLPVDWRSSGSEAELDRQVSGDAVQTIAEDIAVGRLPIADAAADANHLRDPGRHVRLRLDEEEIVGRGETGSNRLRRG